MKRLLILGLAIGMLLSLSSPLLAIAAYKASHDIDPYGAEQFEGFYGIYLTELTKFDTWYTINPTQPLLAVNYFNTEDFGEVSVLGVEYLVNDQTFAVLDYDEDYTLFEGSYLFNFGLFIGALSYNSDTMNETTVSPGYRFGFGDDSYIALRVDYNTDDSLVEDYLIVAKYYAETVALTAKALVPEDSADDVWYSLGLNFKVLDNLVIGFAYASFYNQDNAYEAGLTWGDNDSPVIIDLLLGQDSGENSYYALSGMYQLAEAFDLGLQYESSDLYDDSLVAVKFRYNLGNSAFGFKYILENESVETAYVLGYQLDL